MQSVRTHRASSAGLACRGRDHILAVHVDPGQVLHTFHNNKPMIYP